ncbi:major facilitator superfamily domain-containing protein [Sporodiniella umbellata]|nr:major facilitator superfamily domain-containing protein [Sporodiniella umbellata]
MDDSIYNRRSSPPSEYIQPYDDSQWKFTQTRDDLFTSQSNTQDYSHEEKALFFDKSTINYASVMTFKEDLNLQGSQYSLLGSIFYLGYFLFQLPNNYLLQRVPIGKYIGALVIIWGIILLGTAFGKNFSQLAALRFLLGFFEAGIYPSLTLLISTFYRRSEQVVRLGLFWMCNGLALFVGGLVAYGIGHMNNVGNFKSWQWYVFPLLMIILGSVTIVMGIVCIFFLIDSPKSPALGLNAEQELLVEERTKDNATVRTTEIKREQIWEALKELRFWCFCLACVLINLQNGAMTIYNAQITASLGFNQLQSILLTVGAGGSTILFIGLAILGVRKTQQTIYTACGLTAINIIGLVLLLVIPVTRVKLLGFYLAWSYVSVYVLLITCISNNVTGYTKKIFYNGILMLFYTVGNFVGPLMMVKPPYTEGIVGYLVANCLVILSLLLARWRMAKVNETRLKQMGHASDAAMVAPYTYVQEDISDEQDQSFIYIL